MGSFSIWHWLIVLLIIVLIFGTKKLRNIGQDLGGAVKDSCLKRSRASSRSTYCWIASSMIQCAERRR